MKMKQNVDGSLAARQWVWQTGYLCGYDDARTNDLADVELDPLAYDVRELADGDPEIITGQWCAGYNAGVKSARE